MEKVPRREDKKRKRAKIQVHHFAAAATPTVTPHCW